jgi:hypothetical protein
MRISLAESPTGLVHIVQLIGQHDRQVVTMCGREVNKTTWTRIRQMDEQMFGKGPRAIRKMIELPTCDRCFPE